MYIGKHRTPKNELEDTVVERTPIHIPENYAGNAFSAKIDAETCDEDAPKKEDVHENDAYLPACIETEKEKKSFPPRLDRLFSGDTLLILLAILLAGSEDGGEISLILLLLLLF